MSTATANPLLDESLARNEILLFLGAGVSAQLTDDRPVLWEEILDEALYDLTQDHPTGEWSEEEQALQTLIRSESRTDHRAADLSRLFESVTKDKDGLKKCICNKIGQLSYRQDRNNAVAKFLHWFEGPIITTNYDTLLRDVTGRPPVAPSNWSELTDAVFRQGQDVVIHLHGIHLRHESIVFGWDDYAKIVNNNNLQAAIRAIFASRRVVFIGCGGTADDLNVGGLFAWMHANWSEPRHVFLFREGEIVPTPVSASQCIEEISYGREYTELGPWMQRWRKRAEPLSSKVRPLNHPSREVENGMEAAIDDFLMGTIAEARYEAIRELRLIIGTLSERVSASSAYLFLRRGTSLHLQPDLSQPLPADKGRIEIGQGIVGHVAESKRPYLGVDLKTGNDHHYLAWNLETDSELAVPIFAPVEDGSREILGVLNFESVESHGFLDSFIGEAVAAATEMVPHIQIVNYLDADPDLPTLVGWHPNIHTWDLGHLLNRFCDTISRLGIDVKSQLPRPNVSIWYYDETNKRLYGRGASRFGYEYLSKHTVRKNESFLGRMLNRRLDEPQYDSLDDLKNQDYQKPRQAERMGLRWMISTPFLAAAKEDGEHAQKGVLCLSFYDGANLPDVHIESASWLQDRYTNAFVTSLAKRLGEMIRALRHLREQVAHSYVAYQLATRPVPDDTEIHCGLEAMLRCFGANMGTIFARRDFSRDLFELVGQATTGLQDQSLNPIEPEQARYVVSISGESTGDEGLTTELCSAERLRSNRSVLRVVKARNQLGNRLPINKSIESLTTGETSQRAILGWAVTPPDEARECDNVVGAVRLLRHAHSSPFVDRDETLATRVSSELVHPLSRWHTGWSRPIPRESAISSEMFTFLQVGGTPASNGHARNAAWNSAARLLRAVCTYQRWNLRSVESVVCDLVTVLAEQGAFMASLWVAEPEYDVADDDGRFLRPVVFYSAESCDPPSDRYQCGEGSPSVGTLALSLGQPVSWSRQPPPRFRKGHPDAGAIRASVNFPIAVCGPHAERPMHMVLCVDFKNRLSTESLSSVMPSILLGALKTCCLVDDNTKFPIERAENMPHTGKELLLLFCNIACRKVGLTDIVLSGKANDGKWQSLCSFGSETDELLKQRPRAGKRQKWSIRWHKTTGGGRQYISMLMDIHDNANPILLRGLVDETRQSWQKKHELACNQLCNLWLRTLASSFDPRISPWYRTTFEAGEVAEDLLTWRSRVEYL